MNVSFLDAYDPLYVLLPEILARVDNFERYLREILKETG